MHKRILKSVVFCAVLITVFPAVSVAYGGGAVLPINGLTADSHSSGNLMVPASSSTINPQIVLHPPAIVVSSIQLLRNAGNYYLGAFGIFVSAHGNVINLYSSKTNVAASVSINDSIITYSVNSNLLTVSLSTQNGYATDVTNSNGTVEGALIAAELNLTTAPQILLAYPFVFTLSDYYPYPIGGGNIDTWSGSSYQVESVVGNEEWQQWLNVTEAYTSSGVVSGAARGTFEAPYSYGGLFFYKVGFTFSDTKGFAFNGQVKGGNRSIHVGIPAGAWDWSYWNVSYTNSGTTLTLYGGYFYWDSSTSSSIDLIVSLNPSLSIPSGE
jgi:hypothetical protein